VSGIRKTGLIEECHLSCIRHTSHLSVWMTNSNCAIKSSQTFRSPRYDADVNSSVARSYVFNFSYLANQESTMNWIFQNTVVTHSYIQTVQPTSGFTR
jgi:hypothetical protein